MQMRAEAEGAAMEKDPVEQEMLARGIGNELTEIFVRYVHGEIDFAEVSFATNGAQSIVELLVDGVAQTIQMLNTAPSASASTAPAVARPRLRKIRSRSLVCIGFPSIAADRRLGSRCSLMTRHAWVERFQVLLPCGRTPAWGAHPFARPLRPRRGDRRR